MASRDERRLHNNKAEQIVVKRGHPTRAEAFEGNITLRYIENKGLFLYSYFKSRWYRTELTLDNPTGKKLEKSMVVKSINIIDEIDLKKTRVKGLVADEIEDGLLKAIPTKTKSGLKINDNFKIDGDTNPKLSLGLNDRESLQINTTYDTSENLSEINITTITSASSPNLVLDIAGDIELNADGGQVTIKDDTASHFLFDCDDTSFTIYDDTTSSDFFKILVDEEGATTISTIDNDGLDAALTLDIDGDIELNADGGNITFNDHSILMAGFKNNAPAGHELIIYSPATALDYFRIKCASNGVTTLTTNDNDGTNGTLDIDTDGSFTVDSADEILLDQTNRMKWKKAGTTYAQMDVNTTSNFTLYEQGGASTNDYFQIECATDGDTTIKTVDAAGAAGHIRFEPDGSLLVKETSSAGADVAGYGQLWIKDETPCELYFTTDAGNDIQLTSGTSTAGGGGGTSRWSFSTGGYKTNNNSSTFYYFAYRPNGENWSNSDSSPTTLNTYDASSPSWIAPAAGTLTNITVQGYVTDTGATDSFKFYVFKGQSAHDATTTSLTQIGVTGAITAAASLRNFRISTDISSSNSFSDHDGIWVMLKKDSTSGNQDLYFSVTISGEYS
tara:strand:- start:45 stop:1895 length:1851 start_codon:yes stop_codon:yes gene_type:complete